MSLNDFPVDPAGRQPRGIIKISDSTVTGWIDFTVTNNSYSEADTFDVSFAATALPSSNDPAWFSQQGEIFVEILAGFPSDPDSPNASELTSLIYGRVDDIEFDPVRTIVKLTGRDLTGAFIDTKLTTQYQNKKASDIIQDIAGKHGIETNVKTTDAVVGSPALAKVGTYYLRDTVQLGTNNSEWDLISWLARESGLVAYVAEKTLNFVPDPRSGAEPYLIQWKQPDSAGGPPQANVIDVSFSRAITVAKGISVTARCASFLGPTLERSYPRSPRSIKPGQSSPYGPVQNYYFNLPPGKTAEQVEAFAEAKYREITSHAMKLTASMPADGILDVSTPIRVQGTGTDWDQTYFPRSIRRRLSMEGDGYVMEIEAQNTTPELEQAGSGG